MKRRSLLSGLGAAAVGTTVFAGTASAVTDPGDATKREVFQREYGSFSFDDWNCGRVRVYGIDEYSDSGINDVCDDVGTFLDHLVNSVDEFDGFKLHGYATNLDPFTGDNSGQDQFELADDYVDAFGDDDLGGGNVWLITRDSSGENGSLERDHNIAFGPTPYATDSSLSFQYPHSFTRDNTESDDNGDPVHWSACHELGHQMANSDYYADELPDTDSDHYLAGTVCDGSRCADRSSTIMARPSNAEYMNNGDCQGNASAADSYSLRTSPCERTAFNQSRLGVKNQS